MSIMLAKHVILAGYPFDSERNTMMDWKYLAEKLFPHIVEAPEQVEARYPKRELPEGAKVTRMGPSPTGFMHLGNLYLSLIHI